MESSIFLGFLIAVFLQVEYSGADTIEENYKVVQACQDQLGEEYDQIASGFDPDVITPKQEAIAIEFVGCMWVNLGYITEQGVLNENLLKDFLVEIRNVSRKDAPKIVEQCKKLKGKDYREKAYRVNVCVHLESAKRK